MPNGADKKLHFIPKVFDDVREEWVPFYIAPDATDTVQGDTRLSDSVSSTLDAATGMTAASPKAVKTVQDNANNKVDKTTTADQSIKSNLSSSGRITATAGFNGDLTGNVTGNVSGSAGSVAWSGVTGKPTTISDYGITDAKIANGVITLGSNTITPITAHQAVSNKNATLAWSTTSTIATIGSTDIKVTMPANPNTDKYHKTGSWSGITYTASAVNSADELKFTLPSATTSATGVVQLSSATNSTATNVAATPSAVKAAYDLANTANTAANNYKYWANIESTSAATYNKTPEMATIKLNGNTGASAASTSNVSLVYNSTTQALDFVFA